METAIIVDCRSRDLEVFSASITEAPDHGIVIRKAADLGPLKELSGGEIPQTVILLGSYAAQSSSGFTHVALPRGYYRRFLTGAAGLGWDSKNGRRGDALRPINDRAGEKFSLVVISGGCSMTPLGGNKNSNPSTASAAVEGFTLRAAMRGEVVLIEGQSDYVKGWVFKPIRAQNGLGDTFPPEHRGEMFPIKPDPSWPDWAKEDFVEVEAEE
jgi:hypothetical protein